MIDEDFNRMLDSFASLYNLVLETTERSVQAIGDALQNVAKQLSSAANTMRDIIRAITTAKPTAFSTISPGQADQANASTIVRWWPEDQERPRPRRNWLGRRLVIRAIWEFDQYLMNNMGRLMGAAMEVVTQHLMNNMERLVGGVMEAVTQHLTPFLTQMSSEFGRWFTAALPEVISFLGETINYLYHHTLKPLVQDLLDTVVARFIAKTLVDVFPILEGMLNRLLYGTIYQWLETAVHNLYLSTIRPLLHDVLYRIVYPFVYQMLYKVVTPFMTWITPQLVTIAWDTWTKLITPKLLGGGAPPATPQPHAPRLLPKRLRPLPGLAPRNFPPPADLDSIRDMFFPKIAPGALPEVPSLTVPRLEFPELTFSQPSTPSPALERLTSTLSDVAEAVSAPVIPDPITVNGGINVTIDAASVDAENADVVARQIASRVLDELRRLTEVERFSRGLPTGTTP